ncbi:MULTISPECIES: hypothetical protein [unclassified Pseudomonas]|uniref:hypothetical protein n=1 Tax=unclassified Pseudomonas TaxID=196821 RepID=UPI0015B5FE2F|nr:MULTISPECIES: hypothetical protein [unclassified Pseudomonas]
MNHLLTICFTETDAGDPFDIEQMSRQLKQITIEVIQRATGQHHYPDTEAS